VARWTYQIYRENLNTVRFCLTSEITKFKFVVISRYNWWSNGTELILWTVCRWLSFRWCTNAKCNTTRQHLQSFRIRFFSRILTFEKAGSFRWEKTLFWTRIQRLSVDRKGGKWVPHECFVASINHFFLVQITISVLFCKVSFSNFF
jgi:hypothetical protein